MFVINKIVKRKKNKDLNCEVQFLGTHAPRGTLRWGDVHTFMPNLLCATHSLPSVCVRPLSFLNQIALGRLKLIHLNKSRNRLLTIRPYSRQTRILYSGLFVLILSSHLRTWILHKRNNVFPKYQKSVTKLIKLFVRTLLILIADCY